MPYRRQAGARGSLPTLSVTPSVDIKVHAAFFNFLIVALAQKQRLHHAIQAGDKDEEGIPTQTLFQRDHSLKSPVHRSVAKVSN
jgi:hypothetical protein